MRFAMFCYASESRQWTNEMEDEVLEKHHATEARLKAEGKIGPSLRLMPTTAALTIHARPGAEPLVVDGPFTETKEALLGFWVFDVASLEEAVEIAREFSSHSPGGMLELRPVRDFYSGAFG